MNTHARSIRPARAMGVLSAFVALVATLALSVASARADTDAAFGISEHAATLAGTVELKGTTVYGFEYGTTANYDHATGYRQATKSNVQWVIEGLQPKTTYHYRVWYLNDEKQTLGSDKTFTTEATHTPAFEAEQYPVFYSGDTMGTHTLTINGLKTQCGWSNFGGEAEQRAFGFDLWPAYGECVTKAPLGITFSTTVITGDCKYRIASVKGPPYNGAMSISCFAGKKYEVLYKSLDQSKTYCKYSITSPFGGSKTVSIENIGKEEDRALSFGFEVTGLTFTNIGTIGGVCGPETGAVSYSDSVALEGDAGFWLDGVNP